MINFLGQKSTYILYVIWEDMVLHTWREINLSLMHDCRVPIMKTYSRGSKEQIQQKQILWFIFDTFNSIYWYKNITNRYKNARF